MPAYNKGFVQWNDDLQKNKFNTKSKTGLMTLVLF
jgi:hypothetical protein